MKNGEKKLKFKMPCISMKLYVILHTMITCALILIGYSYVYGVLYSKAMKENLDSDVRLQIRILSDALEKNHFNLTGDAGDLNQKIDTIATLFDGRVIVADTNYRVIKDSFSNCQDSYIVNKNVIQVMTKKKDNITVNENGYIKYIFPVQSEQNIHGVILLEASIGDLNKVSYSIHSKNSVIFILFMMVCLIISIVTGTISARGMKQVNRQMEIMKNGHLSEKIPVKGFSEIRTLTENYNDTISKLMVIDSSRQEFVSNVSHELKTPITSMKVLADSLVQNDEADLNMYKEFMTDIIEEIDRESQIINDLLTLVKMDKKNAELNIEEKSVNGLLEVILKRVTPIAVSRGIEITYESYRDVVAEIDEVKLSLAFNNIIENAIKYNVDNGWVKVTLNADHKFFHVKVVDSGVGIPDDCKEYVFDRFYRVDKARSRDTGGTGLGLAITKNVILMHNGIIKLYSQSGEGTTFTIKIPLKYVERTTNE